MEQSLAFALSAGIGYWWFQSQSRQQVRGPGMQGESVQTSTLAAPVRQQYVPSGFGVNFASSEDNTPTLRGSQQDLITTSRMESRHQILDPLRYQQEPKMGHPVETGIGDISQWTTTSSLVFN
jgi:hypothetical protein